MSTWRAPQPLQTMATRISSRSHRRYKTLQDVTLRGGHLNLFRIRSLCCLRQRRRLPANRRQLTRSVPLGMASEEVDERPPSAAVGPHAANLRRGRMRSEEWMPEEELVTVWRARSMRSISMDRPMRRAM